MRRFAPDASPAGNVVLRAVELDWSTVRNVGTGNVVAAERDLAGSFCVRERNVGRGELGARSGRSGEPPPHGYPHVRARLVATVSERRRARRSAAPWPVDPCRRAHNGPLCRFRRRTPTEPSSDVDMVPYVEPTHGVASVVAQSLESVGYESAASTSPREPSGHRFVRPVRDGVSADIVDVVAADDAVPRARKKLRGNAAVLI